MTYEELATLEQNLKQISKDYWTNSAFQTWQEQVLLDAIKLVKAEQNRWWRRAISFLIDR